MIAVDTNIVVRLLTGDDARQAKQAAALFDGQPVFIPESVVLETERVLRHAYGFDPEAIRGGLRKLFGLPGVRLADPPAMAQALHWHQQGLDFADALHLAGCQACRRLYSFDGKFVRRAKGLGACEVVRP